MSLVHRARGEARLAAALLARADDPDDIAPLFLAADPETRAAIILAAKRRALGRPPQAAQPIDSALSARLESLASQLDRRPFGAALAAVAHAPAEAMQRVVEDGDGEPLALVLAALGMSPAAATRIFLMCDAMIAHSYPRVAALRQLVADISPSTARRLVARFLDVARREPRYLGATDPDAHATPSRNGIAAVQAHPRGAGDPRLRRPAERSRR